MTRRITLEDFDTDPRPRMAQRSGHTAAAAPAVDLEEERLQSFEKGYKAGWDDAAAAHAEDQAHISTELARNLQDMAFTYREAHAALLNQVEALLRGVFAKLLPAIRGEALAQHVVGRVSAACATAGLTAEVIVAPAMADRVDAVLAAQDGLSVRVVPEATLADGQAFLRLGATEEAIDVDAMLTELASAIESFLSDGERAPSPAETPEKEVAHG